MKRIKSYCYRLKKKHPDDDLHFYLGVSEYQIEAGNDMVMRYECAKKDGGRKMCYIKIYKWDRETRKTRYHLEPAERIEPHIHIALTGKRASARAQDIAENLNKRHKDAKATKTPLPGKSDVAYGIAYIENQSSHFWKV